MRVTDRVTIEATLLPTGGCWLSACFCNPTSISPGGLDDASALAWVRFQGQRLRVSNRVKARVRVKVRLRIRVRGYESRLRSGSESDFM